MPEFLSGILSVNYCTWEQWNYISDMYPTITTDPPVFIPKVFTKSNLSTNITSRIFIQTLINSSQIQ